MLIIRIFPQYRPSLPSEEEVIGAVSCIIWTLTLIPLIKYSWIVLYANNEYEEGVALKVQF